MQHICCLIHYTVIRDIVINFTTICKYVDFVLPNDMIIVMFQY